MADLDYKGVGLKVLDVVVGVGSAVAGGYGGPEAAKGVQMAGTAIKGIANDATGDGNRADKLDREGFELRQQALVAKQQQQQQQQQTDGSSVPQASAGDDPEIRAELIRLAWSPAQADQILAGPSKGVTLASLFPANGNTAVAQQDATSMRRVSGSTVPTAEGTKVAQTTGATVRPQTPRKTEEYESVGPMAAIGTILSSFTKKA